MRLASGGGNKTASAAVTEWKSGRRRFKRRPSAHVVRQVVARRRESWRKKQRRARRQPEGGREGKQRGCYYSYWRRSLDNCNLWRRIDRSSRSESERSSANQHRRHRAPTQQHCCTRAAIREIARATVMAGRQDGAPAAPRPCEWPFCPAAAAPARCERRRPALASSCCASPGVAACVQSRGEARPPSSGAVAAPGPPPTPTHHLGLWVRRWGAFFSAAFQQMNWDQWHAASCLIPLF